MARKQTPNKTAPKKVAAGKHTVRKPGTAVSASAKGSAPKVQPLKKDHKQAIKAAAAKVAPVAKKEAAAKKPPAPAKPAPVKGKAKPIAAMQPRPTAAAKPMPPQQAGTAKPSAKPAAPPVGKAPFAAGSRPAGPAVQRPMPAANKQPGHTVTAPASQAAQKAPAKAQPPQPAAPKKPVHQRHGFKTSEWIVYPAHGVGRIVGIEEQEIAGVSLELFVITFEKDKMTLRVPTGKSQSVGMRKLAEESIIRRAMETLKGKARVKRTMWSRRAQEYEAKINSGDLIAIAEVVRDLYRSESQPEQSYSERQLYEAALDRMAREVAVVDKLDERGAIQRITEVLAKSAKGRRMAAEEAEVKAA
jgi:CarD family transcriptional regulator, regulator of rRNA transcription